MDTVFYTLNTRRVKVSGGPDQIYLIPVEGRPASRREGRVLDLELGRRRLETKAAWRALVQTGLA